MPETVLEAFMKRYGRFAGGSKAPVFRRCHGGKWHASRSARRESGGVRLNARAQQVVPAGRGTMTPDISWHEALLGPGAGRTPCPASWFASMQVKYGTRQDSCERHCPRSEPHIGPAVDFDWARRHMGGRPCGNVKRGGRISLVLPSTSACLRQESDEIAQEPLPESWVEALTGAKRWPAFWRTSLDRT
jgi:hypothetical protein